MAGPRTRKSQAKVVAKPVPLATLTFNAAASRQIFAENAKGVRLRLERGHIAFRSSARKTGEDVVPIDRQPRSIRITLEPTPANRRLLQRLHKLDLSEQKPFFEIAEVDRNWFGLADVALEQLPARSSILTVADFAPPPTKIDPTVWRQVQRQLTAGKLVDETWTQFLPMAIHAAQLAKTGRITQRTTTARRLVASIKRQLRTFLEIRERQPELAAGINEVLEQVTGRPAPTEIPVKVTRARIKPPESAPPDPAPEALVTEVTPEDVTRVIEASTPQPVAPRKRTRNFAESLARVALDPMPFVPQMLESEESNAEEAEVGDEPGTEPEPPMISHTVEPEEEAGEESEADALHNAADDDEPESAESG